MTVPPFEGDAKLRQALDDAVNRDLIWNVPTEGARRPGPAGELPPGMPADGALQDMLAQAGVTIELQKEDNATYGSHSGEDGRDASSRQVHDIIMADAPWIVTGYS